MSRPLTYFTSSPPFGTSPGAATYDLWVTDGTNTGTHKVLVSGGLAGVDPTSYATLNGSVYFDGADPSGNFNLFKIDGTTGAVSEIAVGGASSTGLNPTGTAASNGKLFFQGKNAANNVTLWSSDGTAAGTSEVTAAGLTGSYYPSVLTPYGGKLAFASSNGIYLTDGTSAGTNQIPLGALSSFGSVNAMARVGDKLVFSGLNNGFRNALFVADGAGGGAVELRVPALNPSGGYSGRVTGLATFGGKAGFTAVDASGTVGFWVTDGTVAGTIELPGLTGNPYGSSPMVALAGNRLAFVAQDAAVTSGVYISDGTAAGTGRLAVTGTGADHLYPSQVFSTGNQLYMGGNYNGGPVLIASDGTPAGTSLVASGVSIFAGYAGAIAGTLGGAVAYTDTTSHTSGSARADIYTGPVSYLQQQYIWSGTDSVAIAADAAGTFLHGGSGDDALSVTAGSNVLDGGTGSNFLTGATGADGGADTFFVDGRGGGVTWSTINNFHHGDAVTLFGFVAGTSTGLDATTGQGAFTTDGAQGYQGATLHAELAGAGTGVNASLTLVGLSVADAASKLTVTTGSIGSSSYLYVAYTG